MRSFSGPKNNFEGVLKLFKGPVTWYPNIIT